MNLKKYKVINAIILLSLSAGVAHAATIQICNKDKEKDVAVKLSFDGKLCTEKPKEFFWISPGEKKEPYTLQSWFYTARCTPVLHIGQLSDAEKTDISHKGQQGTYIKAVYPTPLEIINPGSKTIESIALKFNPVEKKWEAIANGCK